MKLDHYDRKILEVLIANSKESVTSIAKKVSLRRENVNYRINRLIKEGLIKEFNTILNEKLLNLEHYVIFVQLTNLKEDTEKEILDFLKKDKYMTWIGTSAGKWSLVFDMIIPEKFELNLITNKFLTRFGKSIDEYVILRLHKSNYFSFKLIGTSELKNIIKPKESILKLDNKDKIILSILNRNSRASYIQISKEAGLTPNGIKARIKNLERTGIILGYTISVDWKKLGYEWYGIQLKLIRYGEILEQRLIDYLQENDRVIFYYKYLAGTWDYDIGIIAKDSNELREFINEFRTKFPEEVKIYDISLVLEETSSYKLPEGIFK